MKALAAAVLLLGAAAMPHPRAGAINDAAIAGTDFPATLAEFGFFADAPAQRPARGVTPYRLNTPLWSDGAEKLRFVYVPRDAQARANGEGLIDLPVGSALIKTFRFGGRLIETRVLLRRADGWTALPYRWNEAQSEARLAIAGGRAMITGADGQAFSYAIPNKNQCKECHALAGAVTPIGPKARNLSAAWLGDWQRAGHLDQVPAVARRLPLWEERTNASPADAARGYLDANCAHCHNPQGSASNSGLDLRWEQDDPAKIGIGKRPVAAGRGAGGLEFDVVPGEGEHSILLYRMRSLEPGVAMPELGKATLDPAGIAAVGAWISTLR